MIPMVPYSESANDLRGFPLGRVSKAVMHLGFPYADRCPETSSDVPVSMGQDQCVGTQSHLGFNCVKARSLSLLN